jgi:Family of unknown function (DUF6114)
MAVLLRDARRAFRLWRRTRPFWGGLLVSAGACEILSSEQGPLDVVIHIGTEGLAGYLIPVMLLLCGMLLWFSPAQRTFYSLLAMVLSLGSWVTSNLGGFFLGMILGLVGGALAFAWTTDSAKQQSLRWYVGNPEIVQAPTGLELVLHPTAALPPAAHVEESTVGLRALPGPRAPDSSNEPGPSDVVIQVIDITSIGSPAWAPPASASPGADTD